MQIKNENRKSFKPVSLVFETYEEYKAFEDFINEAVRDIDNGNISFACDTDIVFDIQSKIE